MTMPAVDFVPDPVAISTILESPSGVVGRHVINLATIIQLAMQEKAPVVTGRLKANIVKRFTDAPPGDIAIEVGIWTVPYAEYVVFGSEPHDIPNAFGWGPNVGIGGRFDGKFHPGNKPNPFMTDALGAVVDQLS
jgi:hypothetical protein